MVDDNHYESTRSERFEKRRRTTKLMNYMLILAGILVILLLLLFFFGGDDNDQNETQEDLEIEDPESDDHQDMGMNDEENNENADDETEGNDDSSDPLEDDNLAEEKEESEEDQEADTNVGEVEVEESDEENVKEVVRGNWSTYPTEQEEPHTINLKEESQDRQELEEAAAMAINGDSDDIVYWWFGSEGNPNYVEATIENQADGEIYRVHLEWIENEGWQPQLVKVLEENDQLHRFE